MGPLRGSSRFLLTRDFVAPIESRPASRSAGRPDDFALAFVAILKALSAGFRNIFPKPIGFVQVALSHVHLCLVVAVLPVVSVSVGFCRLLPVRSVPSPRAIRVRSFARLARASLFFYRTGANKPRGAEQSRATLSRARLLSLVCVRNVYVFG